MIEKLHFIKNQKNYIFKVKMHVYDPDIANATNIIKKSQFEKKKIKYI